MNLILNFLAWLLIILWVSPIHAQPLIFAYEDRDSPPFYFQHKDDQSQHSGVTIDVLKLVAKRLNFQAKFVRLPWLRGLLKLKHNKIAGIFHASFKKERLEYGLYPMTDGKIDPRYMLMVQRYHLYTHKDSELNWDGKHFNKVDGAIGALSGYAIISDLETLNIATKESSNLLSLLSQVQNKRLSGLINLENMTDSLIQSNGKSLSHINKISPPIKEKSYYLMLAHGLQTQQPELVTAIWKEIKHIKESGEYQRLLKNY